MHRIAVLALAACWTGGEPRPATREPEAVRPAQRALAITLKRGPCLGACAVYTITIRGDGRVEWLGEDNVAVRGQRSGRITAAALAAIDAKITSAQFFDRDAAGHIPVKPTCVRTGLTSSCSFSSFSICSDTSHTTLTIERGGQIHQTDNAHCSDEADSLLELEELIVLRAGAAAWIGD